MRTAIHLESHFYWLSAPSQLGGESQPLSPAQPGTPEKPSTRAALFV